MVFKKPENSWKKHVDEVMGAYKRNHPGEKINLKKVLKQASRTYKKVKSNKKPKIPKKSKFTETSVLLIEGGKKRKNHTRRKGKSGHRKRH